MICPNRDCEGRLNYLSSGGTIRFRRCQKCGLIVATNERIIEQIKKGNEHGEAGSQHSD